MTPDPCYGRWCYVRDETKGGALGWFPPAGVAGAVWAELYVSPQAILAEYDPYRWQWPQGAIHVGKRPGDLPVDQP